MSCTATPTTVNTTVTKPSSTPLNIEEFFQEAIAHSRCEPVMKEFLQQIVVSSCGNSTFESLYWLLWKRRPSGIGKLGIYDITARICKHFGKKIDVVYLCGNGPLERIKELNLKDKVKKKKVGRLSLDYIEIEDVLNVVGDKYTGDRTDGDAIETFLCVMNRL